MNNSKYGHIYLSYKDEGSLIELLVPKQFCTVQHAGNDRAMVTIHDIEDPIEYTTIHPIEPFSYFMMELTGRALPQQSLALQAHPETDPHFAALVRAGEELLGTTPARPD